MTYKPPLDDYRYLYHEVFDVLQLNRFEAHADLDEELIDFMTEAWGEFATEVWLPSNEYSDSIGCVMENGQVKTPPGFIEAWKQTVEAGFMSSSCAGEWGGQDLPHFIRFAADEIAVSTNMALSAIGGLQIGVYELIFKHGSEELKQEYLPKITTGEWCGTMCLTEPQCGTDLKLITSRAVPSEDGSYIIDGSKQFITGGDHDLTENIIHMVLARLPDAPAGIKGISLFLVPKLIEGEPNGVTCGGLEHKMGLKGSPTCVMNFDSAKGWLCGEPNTGMTAMFEMMNRERVGTGLMGLGLSEISYQIARDYAFVRRQGRDLKGPQEPDEEADRIIVHPDIRRTLLRAKALNEGCRALAVWAAVIYDKMECAEGEERVEAEELFSLLTPVVKAYMTDAGFESANECLQVLGGYGYISEYEIEKYVRDVRIGSIWEGTNSIQALDLVGRKIPAQMGKAMRRLIWPMQEFIAENRDDPEMAEFTKPLHQGLRGLQQLTLLMMTEGLGNPWFTAAGATEFARFLGNVVLGYMWARMARVSLGREEEFHRAKVMTARVFFQRVYPENLALAAKVQAGDRALMMMEEGMF